MIKNIVSLSLIIFLSASCSPFKKPPVSGVVKTVNGGVDWLTINIIKDSQQSLAGLNVSKMDFDPQNSETVYASGFNDGLYRSEDGGGSWQRILSKIWVFDFAVHPFDPKIIYAAGYFGGRGYVIKTEDGGKSWEEAYNEAASEVSVRSIALNPENPNLVVIGNSSGGVVLSDDAGENWRPIKNFQDRVNRVFWQNGQVYVLLKKKGLFKSQNLQNEEFVELTGDLVKSNNFLSSFYGMNEKDFNQAYIDKVNPSLIYLTAGKGAFKTVDEGKNWQKLDLPGKHTSELPARPVAVARASSNLVFVGVGNVIYKTTDGGGTWQTQSVSTNGFVNYILINPNLPQIVYAGNFVSQ